MDLNVHLEIIVQQHQNLLFHVHQENMELKLEEYQKQMHVQIVQKENIV